MTWCVRVSSFVCANHSSAIWKCQWVIINNFPPQLSQHKNRSNLHKKKKKANLSAFKNRVHSCSIPVAQHILRFWINHWVFQKPVFVSSLLKVSLEKQTCILMWSIRDFFFFLQCFGSWKSQQHHIMILFLCCASTCKSSCRSIQSRPFHLAVNWRAGRRWVGSG